jgi:hypothetical protein
MLRMTAAAAVLLCACAGAPQQNTSRAAGPSAEPEAFRDGLLALCGHAYEGVAIHVPATDSAFVGQRLVMHVASCTDAEIRIPFHVGADRSRTWVLRPAGAGLELKHSHRHEDGTPSSNTNYGGRTSTRGTPHRQEFPADAFSIAAVPARASQWWFLEHYPGHRFAYGLFRAETGMHYRIEFDLTRRVATPPPPW